MTDLPFAPVGHDSYFMVFSEDGQRWGNPDRRTGLTIAGTSHLPYLRTQVEQLVTAIGAIASEDARLTPDPDLAVRLDLDVQEVILLLGPILATWKPTDLASVLDLGKR
jgi:hypothetical protein